MNEQEIRAGLERLTKEELIEIFSSLELKMAEKKADLIKTIMTAGPTEEEIEYFKLALAQEKESNTPELPDSSAAPKKPVYEVVFSIKENGIFYPPGTEYDGENIERFLKGKQIRIK